MNGPENGKVATIHPMGAAQDMQARADALAELERVTREHAERPQLIELARQRGAKWAEIASSLGMSVTAARKLHAKIDQAQGVERDR